MMKIDRLKSTTLLQLQNLFGYAKNQLLVIVKRADPPPLDDVVNHLFL